MSTRAARKESHTEAAANTSYTCQRCGKLFLPVVSQRRKVSCPRCHGVYCAGCTVERFYGSAISDAATARASLRLCIHCATAPDIVHRLTREAWQTIVAYCDLSTQQRLLQLCRATQLGVVLPYTYVARGWGALFGPRQLIFKGANGAVYETTLRHDLTSQTMSGPHTSPCEASVLYGTTNNTTCMCSPTMDCLAQLAGTTVAVKTVEKATVYSMKKWSNIQREVDAMQRCRHEHVVPLYFVAQGPSEVYMVMQYVEGGDLFDWLVRQQVPLEADVRLIARQLLTVLHFMHERCGVVHRDIKPENILLDLGGPAGDAAKPRLHIRLADFGYAKVLPQQQQQQQQQQRDSNTITQGSPSATAEREGENEKEQREGQDERASAMAKQTRPILLRALQQARGHASHDAHSSEENEVSEEDARTLRLISTTPCGTLGFAAPEIISAYNAKKAAMQRMVVARDDGNQSAPDNTAATRSSLTLAGTTRDSTSASDGSSTRASHVDPQTPIELFKRLDIFAAGVTICILLTGCEPFPCGSSKEHLQAVLRGMDFSGPEWSYVSKPARRLLRQMLAASAAQRPSALQCLQSAWLRDTRSIASTVLPAITTTTATTTSTVTIDTMNASEAVKEVTTDITDNTVPAAIATGAAEPAQAVHASAMGLEAIPELVSQSFRQSVHTLRKNEPWLFVQDVTGQVTALPRHIVTGEEDQQALSQLNLALSSDTFITA